MASALENFAKKFKGEEGFEEFMQRVCQHGANQSDEKWQMRMEERDAAWEKRAEHLMKECAALTDEKIKAAIGVSEQKQVEAMQRLREEMISKFKGEINEVKSAVGAAGAKTTNSQSGSTSRIDHQIGNTNSRKTFRERDAGTLQFVGKEAIDKSQAAKVIDDTLSELGVAKTGYYFSGPNRGNRFSVKFKPGVANCTEPKETAKFVKNSFAPKGDEDWKDVTFKRDPDGKDMRFGFQYDVASNQQIKEIITKHIHNMIKDKHGGGDFKAFKKEGTLYKKFQCIVRVIVGYREDSFQLKWVDASTFEETGVKVDDVEKELRSVFAKWCL